MTKVKSGNGKSGLFCLFPHAQMINFAGLEKRLFAVMNTDYIYSLCKRAGAVTTDSRSCPAGSVFLALKGENFDGNRFAVSALENGCSHAVVTADPGELDREGKFSGRIIKTDDTLSLYKALARLHRLEFDIPVIAVTGTNGKTTTKELISAVLSEKYSVMATEGNYNNDVGVPKTLLRLAPGHEMAVVEMGASHPGDIKTLVSTAEPTCGLITNVGRAHLEGFGGFEGVKSTKGELYDFLSGRNLFAFVNSGDADLAEMARERGLRTVPYAGGSVGELAPYLGVALSGGSMVRTRLVGAYNLPNVLAAVTVGRYFGVPEDDIAKALEGYEPSNNRSQLTVTEDNELFIDAYNANPSSMAAAVGNFFILNLSRPKKLILGDMGELGDASEEEHQKVVDDLAKKGFRDVWLVGGEFGKTRTSYRRFASVEDVKEEIKREKPRGRSILIKGSHSVGLCELAGLL